VGKIKKQIGSSRYVEIGILHHGLPDTNVIFYDNLRDHIISRGDDSSITIINKELPEATRQTDLNPSGSQYGGDVTLKKLLSRPKPVIKTPKGYYGRGSVKYQRKHGNVPKRLNRDNTIQQAISVPSTYDGPVVHISIEGKKARVRSDDKETTIVPGESGGFELDKRKVEIEMPTNETKEVKDPRMKETSGLDKDTRTVAKWSKEEFKITPEIVINNLGELDVYEQKSSE